MVRVKIVVYTFWYLYLCVLLPTLVCIKHGISIPQVPLQFIPDIPAECLDFTYCEYVPNYPEAYVTGIVSQTEALRLSEKETLPLRNFSNAKYANKFPELIVCDEIHRLVTPRAAKNEHDDWFFILNPKENSFQKIKEVSCKSDKNRTQQSCRNIDLGSNFIYNTAVCKQEQILETLAAIDHRGLLVYMRFPFNCCCSCYVTHYLFNKDAL